MDAQLKQRHRAGMEFLGSVQKVAGGLLQPAAAAEYAERVPEPPARIEERRTSVETALADSAAWSFDRFLTRWVAEEIYVRALPAVESVRPSVERWLAAPGAKRELRTSPGVKIPAYWETEFHLTPGGWDGHDLMGPAISELVFTHVLVPGGVGAVRTGEDAADHRTKVAREGRVPSPRHIVEFGASSGRYTFTLAREYPDSPITALDLSVSALRHGVALAADRGADTITWRHANIEDTGLDDGCADLVTLFSLLHEVPDSGAEAILAEAWRLLEPGGELLIGEVAPYEEHSAFRAVVLDWETENRGEPFWREALSRDLHGMLERAGFTGIESYGPDGGAHPWVTRAVKPAHA